MSEKALNSLLDYLKDTLSFRDKRWVASQLLEDVEKKEAEELVPYTKEQIYAMIDEAERQSENGQYISGEEFKERLRRELIGTEYEILERQAV